MSVINTNVNAIIAQNAGVKNQRIQTQAMQQLSTGNRINSASDDAAGLAISSKMTSQVRGLNQAVRNANDGISLIQTAEGALTEVTNMLQRMRELAVQSASDTNTTSDRTALNAEFVALREEINRIGNNTQFNGMNVLDGSFEGNGAANAGKFIFQVGANAAQTIDITIGDFRTNTGATTTATNEDSSTLAGAAQTTTTTLVDTSAGAAMVFTVNGTQVTYYAESTTAAAIATDLTSGSDAALAFEAAVEAAVGSGVTIAASGAVITITGGDNTSFTFAGTGLASTTSTTALEQTDVYTFAGTYATGDTVTMTVNGNSYSHTVTAAEVSGNAATALASFFAGEIGSTTTGDIAVSASVAAAVLTISGDDDVTFDVAVSQVSSEGVGGDLSGIDASSITTQAGSNSAVTAVDAAIAVVSGARATMGATVNRLNYAADNLMATSANVSASRSRIQDTDYSQATTELARTQIIQQASTAMLAQANQSAQSVLSLLK